MLMDKGAERLVSRQMFTFHPNLRSVFHTTHTQSTHQHQLRHYITRCGHLHCHSHTLHRRRPHVHRTSSRQHLLCPVAEDNSPARSTSIVLHCERLCWLLARQHPTAASVEAQSLTRTETFSFPPPFWQYPRVGTPSEEIVRFESSSSAGQWLMSGAQCQPKVRQPCTNPLRHLAVR
jgi:hypothetical protein